MNPGKAFFDLQLQFAQTVAAAAGRPLAQVLLDCTNLYVRFGLGRDFDAAHPQWQAFIAGLARADSASAWAWEFHRARGPDSGAPRAMARVGCFSCERIDDGHVRLHFHNADGSAHSPLAADRVTRRQAELRELLEGVRRTAPQPVRVLGTSWLYNLPAYRRLFPPAYLASAQPAGPRLRNLSLWGQFLDRHGELRLQPAAMLLQRLAGTRAHDAESLMRCFPWQPLALEAPAYVFEALGNPGAATTSAHTFPI